ncbi:MAG: hypothetical protein E6H75_13495 [Betaproteobacteria bacterium]|nr:MAG: hypothetical protein E6H75_13495 [Betaproteobacteria bacterium]
MSKADRIKEALGWLKVVFAALVAVDVALIAWLAQNFQGAENVLVILALVAVVFTTGAIVGVNQELARGFGIVPGSLGSAFRGGGTFGQTSDSTWPGAI